MWKIGLAQLTLSGASPVEVVDAACAAGFPAVGLRLEERMRSETFEHAVTRSAERLDRLRGRLAASGMRLSNVTGRYLTPDTMSDDIARLVDAAATLGSATVTAIGHDPDTARLASNLARTGELAGQAGMSVALEFVSYSDVANVGAATRVVEMVGRDNVGLMIDPLHLSRSGGVPADIDLVRNRVLIAQLCDARDPMPATRDARIAESRTARLHPGQGDLPLFDLLDRLPAECEVEIEAPHPDDVRLPPVERARRAATALAAFLSDYARHRPLRADWPPR